MSEQHPKETIEVFETVLFTKLSVNQLYKTKLADLVPYLEFVAYVNGLSVRKENNMIVTKGNDLIRARNSLEKLIQWN
jgi:hypothetical protein